MRHHVFFSILLTAVLASCTPKTGQNSTSGGDFRSGAPAPGPAPKIEIGEYQQFELANGLKVLVVENHKLPRVSFQVFVDAPEVMEGEVAGFVNLAGELLTKGTTTRTKAQIDEAVDFMGATISSSANGVSGSCLTKHQEGLLDIMSDVLLNPAFPAEEFEKAKKQTLSGLALAKNNPDAIAENVGAALRYSKKHPYGNVATEKSIANATVDMCRAYYQTYFKPNISYLILVGDITADQAKTLAEKYFGSWQKGAPPKTQYEQPAKPQEPRVVFVDKPGAVQSVINITYPVDLKPGSPDAITSSVMNTLLGGFFKSRLNNNLREDKGFTYGARSELSVDPLVGSFRAYASVRNEVTDSSIVEFLSEMNRIASQPVSLEELNTAKNYASGSFARSLENPQTIARFALNTARYKLPKDYYNTYLERLNAITLEDLQAAAKKYITAQNAYVLVVGNKEAVAEKLLPFDGDKKIEFFDAFGDPVPDMDATVPAGATAQTVIEDYLAAIGGKEKLMGVNNLKMTMLANTQMGPISFTNYVQKPDAMRVEVMMSGMMVNKIIYQNGQGAMENMGQKVPMDAEVLASMKEEAYPVEELEYLSGSYQLALEGVEAINGVKAFKIKVTSPSGKVTTEYYATETSLKLREVSVEQQGDQTVTTQRDFSDYKEVAGILFAHKVVTTGGFPVPLEMMLQSVEVNTELPADLFKVE